MAAIIICSDFGAQENKSVTVSIVSPSIYHEVMGLDTWVQTQAGWNGDSGLIRNAFDCCPGPRNFLIGSSFIIHNEPPAIPYKFMLKSGHRVEPLQSLRMGLVTRKTKLLEDWSFHPPTFGKRDGGWRSCCLVT